MMYVLEYLIYHLKPYGFNTVIKTDCPNNSSKVNNSTASNHTKDAVQGGNSEGTPLLKEDSKTSMENGVQAAEGEENIGKNTQEDFVENPETVDVDIKEDVALEDLDKMNNPKDVSLEGDKKLRVKRSKSEFLSRNPESKAVNENSVLLKRLRRRKL